MAPQSGSTERLGERARTIDQEMDPVRRRERIRVLLGSRSAWADLSQGVDALLRHVQVPNAEERRLLRGVIERCTPALHQPCFDRTCLIRTGAVRLLSHEPETADRDLFIQLARTHESSAGADVAAEMRGLALLGLEALDPELARWLAAECLQDGPVPNDEPQLSAVRVLAARGDAPLLRQWLETREGSGETSATVLVHVELMHAMPPVLWAEWATRRGRLAARPLACMAVCEAATDQGRTDLASPLIDILFAADRDLYRALAISLAIAREPAFVEALLDICDEVPSGLREVYAEALMVARHPRAPSVLARLRSRPARGGRRLIYEPDDEDPDDED